MCDSIWYRSVMPDGGIWTEARSLVEIFREATKWDSSNGELLIQQMTITTVYSPWEEVIL